MTRSDIQDMYFIILEIVTEAGYCPYDNSCPNMSKKELENCVECISEHIVNSGKLKKDILDVILGE